MSVRLAGSVNSFSQFRSTPSLAVYLVLLHSEGDEHDRSCTSRSCAWPSATKSRMTRSRVRPLTINSVKSPGLGGASCCSDSATATGTSLSPSLFASLTAIGTSCSRGAGAVSATSGGSSTGSVRPPEEMHPEQIEMTSNGSANEAPRGTRAKELNNAETGGRKDIMTIILANSASYDLKERVALRRLTNCQEMQSRLCTNN